MTTIAPVPARSAASRAPRHVAIIMDANGRWAARRGLSRTAGHRAGTENIRQVIQALGDRGVRYLTLYAFSTENWKRSPARDRRSHRAALAHHPARGSAAPRSGGPPPLHRPAGRAPAAAAPADPRRRRADPPKRADDGLHRVQLRGARGTGGRRTGDHRGGDPRRGRGRGRAGAAPLHRRSPRPRPDHPHRGRHADLELPDLAVGVRGVLLYDHLLARFLRAGHQRSAGRVRPPRPPLRRELRQPAQRAETPMGRPAPARAEPATPGPGTGTARVRASRGNGARTVPARP